jgi:hypothetical protein
MPGTFPPGHSIDKMRRRRSLKFEYERLRPTGISASFLQVSPREHPQDLGAFVPVTSRNLDRLSSTMEPYALDDRCWRFRESGGQQLGVHADE